jgi:EAL domain-containing protein (putative c-di-GMP-specific phosphodiesterase class I)
LQFIEYPYNALVSQRLNRRFKWQKHEPEIHRLPGLDGKRETAARMNNPKDAESDHTRVNLDAIRRLTHVENGKTVGNFGDLTLRSQFQPIFSVAHSRTVGCEALMRATDRQGHPVSPPDVFRLNRDFSGTLLLDRLARAVHVHNFQGLNQQDGWLFVHVNAEVFLECMHHGNYFAELLEATGLAPHRIVIEVLEQGMMNEMRFPDAVQFFRDQGILIALDNFGAGQSNFDRIWSLQPDMVKLDRSMIAKAGSNLRIRRMMPVMVSLLHEAGSLVVMEGIETEAEALMAMDADADFVQGYYFARPSETLPSESDCSGLFDRLWVDFREVTLPEISANRSEIGPYRNAIGYAAGLLESGIPLEKAVGGFLELPGVERCFLLDSEGRQIGDNIANPRQLAFADKRFAPLDDAKGANWSRRFYFRRALEHPGKIQVTRPYLSITSANQCITVSIGTLVDGEMRVLCGDVAWKDRGVLKR